MLSLLSFVFGFPAQIWELSGGDGGTRQTGDDWDAAKKEEAGDGEMRSSKPTAAPQHHTMPPASSITPVS